MGRAFFLSRLRRADSKLFALLLRTLATKSNLTVADRAGSRLLTARPIPKGSPARPAQVGESSQWQARFEACGLTGDRHDD
jgi:hypothetical protein